MQTSNLATIAAACNTLAISSMTTTDSSGKWNLGAFNGFDAFDEDELVSRLVTSRNLLKNKEEADMLRESAQLDEFDTFSGTDFASGLVRMSASASAVNANEPSALGLAHVKYTIERAKHAQLGHLCKLHLDLGPSHMHQTGVKLGLNELLAKALTQRVLKKMQRLCDYLDDSIFVMWSFDESLGSSEEMGLRELIHKELLEAIYRPRCCEQQED